MNPHDILNLFDDEALRAMSPLFALTVGAMLVLLAGIIPPLRAARHLFVVATLAATLLAEIEILRHPIGTVLVNTYVADRVSALWGILFVAATLLAWLFSVHYYRDDRPFQGEHDFLMLVTPLGMILMAG